ncbi:unnamed protein product, partial [Iphiclides podalirius]
MNDKNSDSAASQEDRDSIKELDVGMMLTRRASDQNVFYTYMCQLNKIPPSSDIEKFVGRCYSRPSQELIEEPSSTTVENSEISDTDQYCTDTDTPKLLKLTKMKWLTERKCGSPDSRSPTGSPSMTFSDTNSSGSEDNLKGCVSFGEKCLSTILRLDKEHNLFGLSNITIVDSKLTEKVPKENEEPAALDAVLILFVHGAHPADLHVTIYLAQTP